MVKKTIELQVMLIAYQKQANHQQVMLLYSHFSMILNMEKMKVKAAFKIAQV